MTICQTIAIDFEDEMKIARTLLERVPLDDAHRAFQPHPKSMTLEKLASHVAELPAWIRVALASRVTELEPGFQPHMASSTAALLDLFDRGVAEARAGIAGATDEDMQLDWTFKFGEYSYSAARTKVIRGLINHFVHHRAQLGVYLRLNDIAIPGMYGPSADDATPAAQSTAVSV